jgi:hypothetical protein
VYLLRYDLGIVIWVGASLKSAALVPGVGERYPKRKSVKIKKPAAGYFRAFWTFPGRQQAFADGVVRR